MSLRLLSLAPLCVSPAAAFAGPSVPVPAFAVVPPSVAAALQDRSGPEARELIAAADAAVVAEPHAVARVHLEGTLPTDPCYRESWDASRDWIKMMQLAMAYRMTADRRYLGAEQRYLDAWLTTYRISLNPIDETPLDQVMIAYDLTHVELAPATQQRMTAFYFQMAHGYLQFLDAEKTEDVYNWQSHRIKLALLASYALADPALIAHSLRLLRHHLEGNLLAGSVVIDFGKRDALHYTVYDLEPLTMAALAAHAHGGPDLFVEKTPNGASLRGAVDWLEPYAQGREKHLEFVHSTAKFDAARANAGVHGYSGEWDASQSLLLYATLSNLSAAYLPLYETIRTRSGCHTHDWLVLLERSGL